MYPDFIEIVFTLTGLDATLFLETIFLISDFPSERRTAQVPTDTESNT